MFGDVALPESTRWYGDPPIRFTRFVGRSEPLFAVDSLLRPTRAASGGERVPVAVVLNGLGGVGKTALASEYATRFAAAYPGGVFWLRLGSPAGGAELAQQVASQLPIALIRIADQLRDPDSTPAGEAVAHADDMVRRDVARHLDQLDTPFLWVVDDLPPGLSAAEFARCLPPGGRGHSLITTQATNYRHVPNFTVPVMAVDESIELLLGAPVSADEHGNGDARKLVARLGNLPLALEVVGALAALPGTTPTDLLAELNDVGADEAIELIEEGATNPSTPLSVTEHTASVVATFGPSIRRLDLPSLWLLAVASALNVGPLPVRLLWAVAQELNPDLLGSSRAALGLLLSRSLARSIDTETIEVHGLVGGAALRNVGDRPGFVAACGTAVQLPILGNLGDSDNVDDIRTHAKNQRLATFGHALMAHFMSTRPDVIDIDLCRILGRFLHVEQRYAEAVEIERFALDRLREFLGPNAKATLNAQVNLALSLQHIGKVEQSIELQSDALEGLRTAFGAEDIDTLSAQHNLASVLGATDPERSRELALDAYRTRLRVLGADHPHTLYSLHSLLAATVIPEPYADAVAGYQDLIERRTRTLGPDHTTTLTSISNFVQRLTSLGRAEEALPMARHLVDRRSALYGPYHPSTLTARVRLISVLAALPEPPTAELMTATADIVRYATTTGERSDVTELSNIGNLLRQIGMVDAAVLVLRAALQFAGQDPGPHTQTALLVEHNLAAAIAATGDLAQGRDEFSRLVPEMTGALGPEHRLTLRARRQLAIIASKLNDPSAWSDLLGLAEIWRRLCGEQSPEYAEALGDLADAAAQRGRPEDAARYRDQQQETGHADDIDAAGHI